MTDTTAADRVEHYLEGYATFSNLDQEVVHSVGLDGGVRPLNVADLAELIRLARLVQPEDVTGKMYLRVHYGEATADDWAFDLATLPNGSMYVDATGPDSQEGQALLNSRPIWEHLCAEARKIAEASDV